MKKILILTIIIIIAIIVSVFAFDTELKIVNYDLKTDKISGDVKLALVTDLHSCLYGENQIQLTEAIDNYKPDAILMGGDIFDDYYINENSNILIENIVKKYKTYYVSGNHEWWSGKMDEHFDYLTNMGVTVLRGDTDYLSINDNIIAVSGVDDPEVDRYDEPFRSHNEQLEVIGDNIGSENYNILLAHRPENVNNYINYDFDLILSGHAHGGQWRIPNVLNGFYAPNQGFLPEWAGGIYGFEDRTLIVSRGLSRENTKLPRIFNRPELVFITITP